MRHYPAEWDEKAPNLIKIAEWINENTTLVAKIVKGYCNTDSKIAGTRFIRKGKGRKGNQLIVAINARKLADAELWGVNAQHLVFWHNSAETYHRNSQVVFWLQYYLRDNPKILKTCKLTNCISK
jgi:hypothetical protein